jgi:hypothetical protein
MRVGDLVDSLKYYISGSDNDRREQAAKLLEDYKKDRALKYLAERFKLQGIEAIDAQIKELRDFKEEKVAAQIEETLQPKPVKKKKALFSKKEDSSDEKEKA